MNLLRFTSWVAAAVLAVGAGSARGDGPPSPPPPESHGLLEPGQTVQLAGGEIRVVPREGALYLEPPAYVYVSELRRRLEVEVEAAEKVAERERDRAFLVGIAVGLAAGAAAGWAVGR